MSVLNSLHFVATQRRFLSFGLAMTFASSVGQTYFIGVFGPSIQIEFNLSHAQWGSIYMVGTLLSAALLPWTGAQIDRLPLGHYTAMVITGLVVAATFTALVPTAGLLILAVFLLRQAGQGLASHLGTTATARHFATHRGKAVALVSLGFALGESILPVLAVLAIGLVGWRATYGTAAFIVAITLPAICWGLLRGSDHVRRPRSSTVRANGNEKLSGSWTRRDVLRDGRFYLLLPAVLAPSFIITALFFHHLTLAEIKGWSTAWLTGSYWIFALGSVLAMLVAGLLVDRLTAVRVLPGFLLPLALGLLLVWGFDHPLYAWPYLFLIGLTGGIAHTAITALWAEIYGVWHLGAIRSLAIALSVFSSALGPAVVGGLMDRGLSVEIICLSLAVYCFLASLLLLVGLRGIARRPLRDLP